MNLSAQETILLGTAIAFELAKNTSLHDIKILCSLLSQVLYTLSNLGKN